MGRNKALMRLDGEPLIARLAKTLAGSQRLGELLLITNTPSDYEFLKLPMYADAKPGAGPLGGIYTALLRARFDRALVVACDMPFISAELVEYLCQNGVNHEAFALESEKDVEPLCAVYAKSCLPVIEQHLRDNRLKVSDFYDEVDAKIMRFDPSLPFYKPNLLANVNTPEEFEQAQQIPPNS